MLLERDLQKSFLAWSLSHAIDALGRRQHAVLAQLKLKPIQMSLLLRAGRKGKVRFDDFRRDTGLPIHAISRAASRLKARGLGTVKNFGSDKRRRRFHIGEKGRKLLGVIETKTAESVMRDIGVGSQHSKRYFEFTVHLWNLTRFLPEEGCGNELYFFPTEIDVDDWESDGFDGDPLRFLVEPLWAKRGVSD